MIMSMVIEVLTAERAPNRVKRVNDVKYTVLLPRVSENEDHQSGNIDMLSIYKATERFVTVEVIWKSADSCGRAAIVFVRLCMDT